MARLEAGAVQLNKAWQPLEEVVGSALAASAPAIAAHRVEVTLPDDLPLLQIDAVLMERVLVNLLENALRYTPGDSPVEVRAAMNGDVITVEVCDRGPGISAVERERVFEKFYRGQAAKQNDGGTGLGLTICRAVVLAHGGRIGIFERTGGGARVRFTLPLGSSAVVARMSMEGRPEA
jgi:two-component system sensor histidine kinase KdpD